MKKTMLVMSHEIRAALRRKAFLIMGFGLPVAMALVALVIGFINRDGGATLGLAPSAEAARRVAEGYVDAGGLIQALPEDIPPGWLTEYPDEAAALAALQAEEIDGYYLISADYVQSRALTYVRRQYDPLSGGSAVQAMEWVLLANVLGDAELAARVRQPLDVEVTALVPAGEAAKEEGWITELLPTLMALILYMAILLPSSTLVNAVTDEKKNRVMEVLMSSLSPYQMITGKIVAVGLLGLLQLALWIGLLWGVVRFGGRPLAIAPGAEVPTQMLVWAFVYGLLGYAMYGAQMAGVGALAPDIKDSKSVSFLIMAPLIVVYMFLITIVINPDGPLALFFSLFPLTSPVGMIARMTQTSVPLWQAVLAAALQLLTAILVVRLVAGLFRAQHMLSGQAFSVGRFYRTLLGRA